MERNNTTDLHLDPAIWGPKFWFFIQTIALQYPNKANDVIKKKYFTFFTDMEVFLPNLDTKKTYIKMLNDYPLSPYLDSRISLLKWVNFIHNKYNILLNKEPVELYKGLDMYYNLYNTNEFDEFKMKKKREKQIYISLIAILSFVCIYLYYINIYEI